MNFESGAMGNPTELTTLIRFWTQMENLHYPMAESIRKDLQDELNRQREAAQTPPAAETQQNATGAAGLQQTQMSGGDQAGQWNVMGYPTAAEMGGMTGAM